MRMKLLKILVIFAFLFSCSAQKKFRIIYDQEKGLNYIVDKNAKKIKTLDEKYFKSLLSNKGVLVDIKGMYRGKFKGLTYWSL